MRALADADFPLFGDWDDPGEISVALVFAVDAERRVLMQLRDDRPEVINPGTWAPFGGHVEPGETLLAAALREFDEETGLTLSATALTPLGRRLSERRTRLYAFRTTFSAEPSAIRLGEGAGFGLLTEAQIASYPLAPGIRAMAEAALAG